MADSIVRLRVDSQEYDNKLKRAAEGLNRYIEGCRKAGGTLEHVDDGVMEFIRSLSKMDTVASNTKGKLNEMTNAFTELTMKYNHMTDAEKNGQFGRALNAELEQVKRNIISTKQEMASIQSSLSGGSGFKDILNGVAGKFGMSASMFTGVGAAVAGAAGAFKLLGDNISLAMNFEKSMSQLSSLTGMVGKDLDQLKEYAIELGSTSTLTASQVADAFRLIGSQQPQLLESGQALKEVTKYAITLSEAAGIDLQTAAQTLSTSINQMGGDSNNAARYVNVLAAASQKGAGDIAWLGEAITKSATAAKAVGTDYEELVANLEQLAKAGFDASTAGTALRSIIMNLEKQANNDFKPSVVGLTKAFENLGKANLDIVGYQQIAGKMFASQAMALANAAKEARNMTEAITGTNTAVDQAKTNTDNLDGALKSLSSAWEGLNLHINASSGALKDVVDWAAELIRKLDGVTTAGGRAAKALREMNGAGGSEGPTKVDQQIGALRGSKYKRAAFNATMKNYRQQLADYDMKIANGGKWESKDRPGFFHYENVDVLKAQRAAVLQMAREYQTRGLREITPTPAKTDSKGNSTITLDVEVDTDEGEKNLDTLKAKLKELKKLRDEAINKKDFKARDSYNAQIKQTQDEIKLLRGGSTTTTTHVKPIEEKVAWDANKANIAATKTEDAMPSVWAMMGGDAGLRQMMGIGAQQFDIKRVLDEYVSDPDKEKREKANKTKDPMMELSKAINGLTSIRGGLEGMGIKLPAELEKGLNVLQGLMSIIQGVQAVISIFSTSTETANTIAVAANTVALGSLTAAVTANTMTNFFPFAKGGVVHAANGYVDGNTYSGDQIPAMLNAGELVLNKAQQGVLASSLQSVGQSQGGGGRPYLDCETIWLGLGEYTSREGMGKIVTSRRK